MKKLFTFMVMALLFSAFTMAQTYVLDDFENGLVNFTSEVHVNPSDNFDVSVVANPASNSVNSTSKCWKWTRLDAGAANNKVWGGFWSILTNPIAAGTTTITVKFYRTNPNSLLKIHCESSGSAEFFPVTAPTKVNQWELLTFDLATNWTKNITVLGFQPDFPADGSTIDIGAMMYIDEITVTAGTPPPPPTKLTLLDDSSDGSDNTYHDGCWINPTAPSTVLQATGHDSKFPVVTSPVKSGVNALELDWKSVTGGDWVALVAGNSWPVFDVTTMVNLRFWVNSPVAIAAAAMPKLYLESTSGNPNHTGKIPLGNYLTNLAANTWTQVTIPLADFWASDLTFTSKSTVHGVFFCQNAPDNVEHIMYLDLLTFDTGTTGLFNPKIENNLNAYYTNSEIHIPNFAGNVKVFDVTGKIIANQYTSDGIIKMNLNKGIYFVNSQNANSKLIVY
jgi:hypothetical protein